MYCTKCGAPNDNTSRFCVGCGSPLETAAPAQPGYAPPAPAQAPKKGKKKLLLLIAAAATLLLLVIVLVIAFSGSSPEDVVEDYLEAEFEGDQEAMSELMGIDPRDLFSYSVYTDLDMAVAEALNKLGWYERTEKIDLDYDYWYDRLDRIRDMEDFYRYWLEFSEAEAEAITDAYDASYEILLINTYELQGTDARDARNRLKDIYEYWETWDREPVYELYEIDAFYEVNVAIKNEHNGETWIDEEVMLLVEYHGECYIALQSYIYEN